VVKIGFIAEGESEKIILESNSFRAFLSSLKNIEFIPDVIDATGYGNILPQNREGYVQMLKDKGATKILYLVDREEESCISSVKDRIKPEKDEIVIVSVRALEAWYLADSIMLSSLFKKNYLFNLPESTELLPMDVLRQEFFANTGRGLGKSKPRIARRMINSGFSVLTAAAHKNCSSAKYFLDKLKAIASNAM
jgi:hypothetical protein